MENFVIYTKVADTGQDIYAFDVPFKGNISQKDVHLSDNFLDSSIDNFLAMKTGRLSKGIRRLSGKDGILRIEVEPFSRQAPFRLKIGDRVLTGEDAERTDTLWADRFRPYTEGEVIYRLYEPESASGKRPLILFLHGGAECGRDNWKQMVGCFGAAHLAESYPDCYVMAPQAKGKEPSPEDIEAFLHQTFATSDQPSGSGWDREYLAGVCDIIRRMIDEGKVNPARVYVTGMSMGGAGTLRAMSVGADLFAAALPVCPSMTPETFSILKGLVHSKIWITAAYIDHTHYRHKYIVDGIMALRDGGNQDAHLTLFSPEELAEYGIGIIPDMPLEAKLGWNHTCWIPTYHNASGALGWMMEQVKN